MDITLFMDLNNKKVTESPRKLLGIKELNRDEIDKLVATKGFPKYLNVSSRVYRISPKYKKVPCNLDIPWGDIEEGNLDKYNYIFIEDPRIMIRMGLGIDSTNKSKTYETGRKIHTPNNDITINKRAVVEDRRGRFKENGFKEDKLILLSIRNRIHNRKNKILFNKLLDYYAEIINSD